ncbi:DUF4298 domain-containing protein [Capnocytophaga canimorsus]|uniref:DUF4298 domain-containing protein n=1 Tax=Capnocytophaga canimorsus TaxID=28188 RepID=UPI0037D020A5
MELNTKIMKKMTPKQLQNIAEMEEILNKIEDFTPKAEEFLKQWQELLPEVQKLNAYYGSDQWRQDYDDANAGKIPEGMPHGVLSEDLAYNTLGDQYFLAVDFLKLVTKIISREE